MKSGTAGVMDVILAILFAADSITQVLPEESTITSCGWLAPNGYSVNCPFTVASIGVVTGVATIEDALADGEAEGVSVVDAPPACTVVGVEVNTVPPAEGSNVAIWPLFD